MRAWFSEHIYGITGIADANGDPALPIDNVFDHGETFQADNSYLGEHVSPLSLFPMLKV